MRITYDPRAIARKQTRAMRDLVRMPPRLVPYVWRVAFVLLLITPAALFAAIAAVI